MRPRQTATASEPPPPPRSSAASAWAEPRRRPPASVATDDAPSIRSPGEPGRSVRAPPASATSSLNGSRSSRRFQPQLQGLHPRKIAQLQELGSPLESLHLRKTRGYARVVGHL